jgi:hypothetical protein
LLLVPQLFKVCQYACNHSAKNHHHNSKNDESTSHHVDNLCRSPTTTILILNQVTRREASPQTLQVLSVSGSIVPTVIETMHLTIPVPTNITNVPSTSTSISFTYLDQLATKTETDYITRFSTSTHSQTITITISVTPTLTVETSVHSLHRLTTTVVTIVPRTITSIGT